MKIDQEPADPKDPLTQTIIGAAFGGSSGDTLLNFGRSKLDVRRVVF